MSFETRLAAVEQLIARIEAWPDTAAREQARALMRAVLDLHAVGLARVLELCDEPERLLADPITAQMLLLHDLHPQPLEQRVRQALEAVRPALLAHGGNVELIAVAGQVVRLQLEGSCHGCPSSEVTLRHTIETAILEAAPTVERIEVEHPVSLLAE